MKIPVQYNCKLQVTCVSLNSRNIHRLTLPYLKDRRGLDFVLPAVVVVTLILIAILLAQPPDIHYVVDGLLGETPVASPVLILPRTVRQLLLAETDVLLGGIVPGGLHGPGSSKTPTAPTHPLILDGAVVGGVLPAVALRNAIRINQGLVFNLVITGIVVSLTRLELGLQLGYPAQLVGLELAVGPVSKLI